MAINFPSNPSVNDTYQVNGRVYVWNGESWRKIRPRLAEASPTLSVTNDFAAGGAFHVDADTGRVGIGTANPAVELHVDGDVEFTGTLDVSGAITTPTPLATTNDTTVATTQYVTTAIANLIDGAPAALDTINELAAAINDDQTYAVTITNSLAEKLPLAGGTMTGSLYLVGEPTSSTEAATKSYVDSSMPPGTIVDYVGVSAPAGWAILDGSTIVNAEITYPSLWAVLPATFKSGSNLVLPDTRGRVAVGRNTSDADFDNVGDTGGAKTVTLTAAQSGLPAHNHSAPVHAHSMRHAHDRGNHTHGVNQSSIPTTNHTHGDGSLRAAVGASGSDANSIAYLPEGAYQGTITAYTLFANGFTTASRNWNHWTDVGGSTGTPSATTSTSVSITSSGSGVTGRARNEANTANVDNTENNAAANTGNNTAASASEAHSNVQPYITFSKMMKLV